MTRTDKISAVVVSYNRAEILETTLAALAFVDELIVVDKGSTDGSARIAQRVADRFVSVAWSPTVEETRAKAVALCSHEWILSLDDDECLNAASIKFIAEEIQRPRADIYQIPFRHYIMGRHSEAAHYWPEFRPALFRRASIEFGSTVHGGLTFKSDRVWQVPIESDVCIHHLSHKDAHTFIEKTNRYTSCSDRVRAAFPDGDLPSAIELALSTYFSNLRRIDDNGYAAAVLALRGVYEIVDCIKQWEQQNLPSGAEAFKEVCQLLQEEYRSLPQSVAARNSESETATERSSLEARLLVRQRR